MPWQGSYGQTRIEIGAKIRFTQSKKHDGIVRLVDFTAIAQDK